MQKLVFVNGSGNEIDLTAGHYGITNWSGLSDTELNIQTQKVPFQDGSVFLDALLNDRELSFTVAINDNNDLALRYQLKRELISMLNPKLNEGYLYYTNDYLSRRIKVEPKLPIFQNKNSNDSGTLKASVTFTACGVYWEDVEETKLIIPSNTSKTLELNSDIETSVRCFFSNGGQNASLQINDKKVNFTESNSCRLNTQLGKKTFESLKLQPFLKNGSFNFIKKYKGWYYLAGGLTNASQLGATDSILIKSKNLTEFLIDELGNKNYAYQTNYITGMDFSELSNVGIVTLSHGGYYVLNNNNEWVLKDYPLEIPLVYGCVVIDRQTPLVLIASEGGLYVNDDAILDSWTNFNSDVSIQGIKKADFVCNGSNCIAMIETVTPNKCYAVTENYELIEIMSQSQRLAFDYVNGYFYDFTRSRRTSDFETWESVNLQNTSASNVQILSLIYEDTEGVYYAMGFEGCFFKSYDGLLFQEIKIYPHTGTSYNGYQIFYDKDNEDILIVGSMVGLESFYRGTILDKGEEYTYILKNKKGTLYIKGSKAWFKSDAIITLPIWVNGATCSNELYVISNIQGYIYSSEDGINWVSKGRVPSMASVMKLLYNYESGFFGICGSYCAVSNDLSDWTPTPYSAGTPVDMVSMGKYFLFLSSTGQVFYLDDTLQVSGIRNISSSPSTKGIYYDDVNDIIIVTIENGIYTLQGSNLLNWWMSWGKTDLDFTIKSNSLIYNKDNGIYIAISQDYIRKSSDLRTWQTLIVNYMGKMTKLYAIDDLIFLNMKYDFFNISYSVLDNIINKIEGDMDLKLSSKNLIVYKNNVSSNLVLSFRQKYVGV